MLSPGKHHLAVPKDYRANLRFRLKLLRLCRDNKTYQRAAVRMCQDDILAFVNLFVFQFNPNSIGDGSREVGPFITWDFQDQALVNGEDADEGPGLVWCVENRKDVVIIKSREMGASWLCVILIAWLFLFHGRKKILVISRNAEAVDRPDDPDSLFWKIDFIIRHLPGWMTAGRVRRRKMGFYNPALDSSITGQATTGKAGVGGRASLIFVDEFPQIDEDFEVLSRTSDTAGCRVFNGTHLGTGSAFYQLTDPSSVVGSFIKRLTMHWTQHPDKRRGLYRYHAKENRVEVLDKNYHFPPNFNFVMEELPSGGPFPGLRSPWYDDQCRRKASPRAIAEDLDINAEGSVSQFFNPVTLRRIIETECREPYWEGDVGYDRELGKGARLTERKGGLLKLWVHRLANGSFPEDDYGGGVDVSMGEGATNSCLSLSRGSSGEKVLEYATANQRPVEFATLVVSLCRLFTNSWGDHPLLAWEIPGPGMAFGARVVELGYTNVYNRDTKGRMPSASREAAFVPGWSNNTKTLPILLEEYRYALYERLFVNRSRLALLECEKFEVRPDGSIRHSMLDSPNDPTGARVNHGDRVVADALSYKMVKGAQRSDNEKPSPEKPPANSFAARRLLRREQESALRGW